MPVPPFPQSYPNCATAYLYQLGDLHYYATVDCATGATGFGVDGSVLPAEGCDEFGQCKPGSTVERALIMKDLAPAQISEAYSKALGLAAQGMAKGRRPKYQKSKGFRRELRKGLARLGRRAGDLDGRRQSLAAYFNAGNNLQDIYDLPPSVRDPYLELLAKELRSVRLGALDATSDIFLVEDHPIDARSIPNGQLGTLFEARPAAKDAVASDVTFSENGTLSCLLRIEVDKPFAQNVNDKLDVFFRMQRVQASAATPAWTHYIGQQIDEADLIDTGGAAITDKTHIKLASIVDRHSHFHVIRAQDTSGGTHEYVVFSAQNIGNSEMIS